MLTTLSRRLSCRARGLPQPQNILTRRALQSQSSSASRPPYKPSSRTAREGTFVPLSLSLDPTRSTTRSAKGFVASKTRPPPPRTNAETGGADVPLLSRDRKSIPRPPYDLRPEVVKTFQPKPGVKYTTRPTLPPPPRHLAYRNDPPGTALRLTHYLKDKPQLTSVVLAGAEELVKRLPANVVVWNMLIAAYGRAGAGDGMWGCYNDMKKKGILPSLRTYLTLLTAYSNSRSPVSAKTTSRATLIYDQSQTLVRSHLASLASGQPLEAPSDSSGINNPRPAKWDPKDYLLAPTNAYLSFLTKGANWKEMDRVFATLPTEGLLAPDRFTYAAMFNGVLKKVAEGGEGAAGEARGLWDRLMRQMKERKENGLEGDKKVVLDSAVVNLALQCLLSGEADKDREYKEFGLGIIKQVYGLSSPGESAIASSSDLPTLPIDERVVETVLKLCLGIKKPHLAAHYASQFLEMKGLLPLLRVEQYNAMLGAFAAVHDTEKCEAVLALAGKVKGCPAWTWPAESYLYALRSASRGSDSDAALRIYKAATELPVDKGEEYKTMNRMAKRAVNFRNKKALIEPDPRMMGLVLRSAVNSGRVSAMRTAFKVFKEKEEWWYAAKEGVRSYDHALKEREELSWPDKRRLFWQINLTKDVLSVTERLAEAREGEKTGVTEEEEEGVRRSLEVARGRLERELEFLKTVNEEEEMKEEEARMARRSAIRDEPREEQMERPRRWAATEMHQGPEDYSDRPPQYQRREVPRVQAGVGGGRWQERSEMGGREQRGRWGADRREYSTGLQRDEGSGVSLADLPPTENRLQLRGVQWSTALPSAISIKGYRAAAPHFDIKAVPTSRLPRRANNGFPSALPTEGRLGVRTTDPYGSHTQFALITTIKAVSKFAVERNRVKSRFKGALRLVVTRRASATGMENEVFVDEEIPGGDLLLAGHTYIATLSREVYDLPMPQLINEIGQALTKIKGQHLGSQNSGMASPRNGMRNGRNGSRR